MRILSWNVNGIRAVYKRGFLGMLKQSKADIFCIQEVKAQIEQIPKELKELTGYHFYFNQARKKGYAGVALWTREKPEKTEFNLDFARFDQEGRMLKLKYSDFILLNLYLPHGGRQKEHLDYKLTVYKHLMAHLKKIKDERIVLIGDFNIARQEIDLSRPRENVNNIMFTPAERRQMNQIIELGFSDTFRQFHKEGGHYTWWPYFANARERNLGWRIDYVFTSKKLTPKLKHGFILEKVLGSDHCPIGIEI